MLIFQGVHILSVVTTNDEIFLSDTHCSSVPLYWLEHLVAYIHNISQTNPRITNDSSSWHMQLNTWIKLVVTLVGDGKTRTLLSTQLTRKQDLHNRRLYHHRMRRDWSPLYSALP